MNILHLVHTTVRGGADYERSHHLALGLASLGNRVTLIASAQQAGLVWRRWAQTNGVTVMSPPDLFPGRVRNAGLSPIDLFLRQSFVRSHAFDVVHTFGPRPVTTIPGRRHRRIHGSVLVADWSDLWGRGGLADIRPLLGRAVLGGLDDRWERQSRLAADGVTVVSDFLESLALGWGIPRDRVLNLGVGASVGAIRPGNKVDQRRRHGIDPLAPVVLYSGQSRYDWPPARQVLRRLLARNPAVVVIVAGLASENVRKDFETSQLARIVSLGYVSQPVLSDLLACSDVCLVPLPERAYNRARLPNRLGDALAAGRAILTNKHGDLGRIVADEGVGLALDDTEAMAEGLNRLLKDPERLAVMGAKARRLAEERFGWPQLARCTLSFYERLLA